MTMPYLMCCEHSVDGWCLTCVNQLQVALTIKANLADGGRVLAVEREGKLTAENARLREALGKIAGLTIVVDSHADCGNVAMCAIEIASEAIKERCPHEWVDARNSHVLSGEMCPKCGAVRAKERL